MKRIISKFYFSILFLSLPLIINATPSTISLNKPTIEDVVSENNTYKISVTLSETLPAGYYVAVNFDNLQGQWLSQTDPGGHNMLDTVEGTTHSKVLTLNYPGLRSFRTGIFNSNNQLINSYSEGTTCTTDSCFAAVAYYSGYGNPSMIGKASQLVRGVDITNGNFNTSTSDLDVSGVGPSFNLIRSYNSSLGEWSFNYDMEIKAETPSGGQATVLVIGPREDGRYQYYYQDMLNNNEWTSLTAGNFDKLIEETDGSFTLYTKGNLYYKFGLYGRLESINDRDGKSLSFSHSTDINTIGMIIGATDSSGRNYTITRNYSGKITKVSDFTGRFVEYTWDGSSNLSSYKNPKGLITNYEYINDSLNNNSLLSKIIDPRGNVIYTFTYYDSSVYLDRDVSAVKSITDAAGNKWEYTYSSLQSNNTYVHGVKRPATNGINNNMAFIVDKYKNRIIEKIDAENYGDYKTKMLYKKVSSRKNIPETSLVTQLEKPSGALTNFTYHEDGTGNLNKVTDALNREKISTWTNISNQTNLTPISTVKLPGVTNSIQYSSYTQSGKAGSITNPLGNTTSYSYDDTSGQLKQITDPLNNLTKVIYDTNGRPTTITDALNNNIVYTYDNLGRILSQKNKRGYITSYTYDANDNIKTITSPDNDVISYTYDASDNLITVTDPKNNTITFTYDAFNRKISESYKIGAITYTRTIQYDALSRVSKLIDESNNANETQYSTRSKVVKTINPLSEITTFTYDKNGNIETIKDAENRLVTYTYDALDRVTRVTDSLNLYEEYTYNSKGLLATKRDKKARITRYDYDDLGQLIKFTQPDGKYTVSTYDANGNISSTTDSKGQKTTYIYDAINRMTSLKDVSSNKTWSFTYDANGNLLTKTLPSNKVISYVYDKLDRVTKVTYHDGKIVSYTYDANGNRLTMVDSNGTTSYTYDELNRLTSVNDVFGNTISYSYHPNGTLKELIYPGNKKVTYAYNAASQLSSLTDWLGDTTSYTKDKTGLTKTISYGNGTTVSKAYDEIGRLNSLLNKKGTTVISSHTMTLDAMNNPIQIEANIPLIPSNLGKNSSITFTSLNMINSFNGNTTTHDTDGRLTNLQTDVDPIEYAYNAQDLITNIKENSISTESFKYDGDGKRVERTVNGQTTRYIQDPTGGDVYSLLAQTNNSNTVQYYYVYGEGLVSQINGSSHKYYHFDQAGNTLALTDDSGNITDKYAYEPFGNTTVEGTSYNPFRFVGQYGVMDEGNDLHYMRARYYNRDLKRFVSLDALYGSVTDPMTLNRYQYVSGNPMVGVDPSGFTYSSIKAGGENNYVEAFKLDYGQNNDRTIGLQATWLNGQLSTGDFDSQIEISPSAKVLYADVSLNCENGYSNKEYTDKCKVGGMAGLLDGSISFETRYLSLDVGGSLGSIGAEFGIENKRNIEGGLKSTKLTFGGALGVGPMGGVGVDYGQVQEDIKYVTEEVTKRAIYAQKNLRKHLIKEVNYFKNVRKYLGPNSEFLKTGHGPRG